MSFDSIHGKQRWAASYFLTAFVCGSANSTLTNLFIQTIEKLKKVENPLEVKLERSLFKTTFLTGALYGVFFVASIQVEPYISAIVELRKIKKLESLSERQEAVKKLASKLPES